MNILLLEPTDIVDKGRAVITDQRQNHVRTVQRAVVGDSLRVGEIDGQMGRGQIVALREGYLELSYQVDCTPPAALNITVVLALPRPKMLKRTLHTLACMGVKRIVLLNSYRVEKSFWQTPLLKPESIRAQLLQGLAQARDTVVPEIIVARLFRPFVEDRLAALCAGKSKLLAHPGTDQPCPSAIAGPAVVAIGPEGGFIPYEVEALTQAGFQGVHLGPRILRVEMAVPVLLGRLYPHRGPSM